jgi:microcompartment protein CcmK/EutM
MENTNVEPVVLGNLIATKRSKKNVQPAKKYLIQCKPEVAEKFRKYFNIPDSVSDAGCGEYIISYAQVGKDSGFIYTPPVTE